MQKANCNFTRFSLCLSISLTKSYNNIILLTIYKKLEVTIIFITSDSLYLFYTVLTPKSAPLSGLSFPCFSLILNCCICFNASSWHSFSALIFLCYLLFSSLLHTFFFQTAKALQIRQYMILHIRQISHTEMTPLSPNNAPSHPLFLSLYRYRQQSCSAKMA